MSEMLKAEHVCVKYGDLTIVDDLSFRLEEGQWLMLVGPNGAGKSTMVEAISQGAPYSGNILLQGKNIRSYKPGQLARMVGVLALPEPHRQVRTRVQLPWEPVKMFTRW